MSSSWPTRTCMCPRWREAAVHRPSPSTASSVPGGRERSVCRRTSLTTVVPRRRARSRTRPATRRRTRASRSPDRRYTGEAGSARCWSAGWQLGATYDLTATSAYATGGWPRRSPASPRPQRLGRTIIASSWAATASSSAGPGSCVEPGCGRDPLTCKQGSALAGAGRNVADSGEVGRESAATGSLSRNDSAGGAGLLRAVIVGPFDRPIPTHTI